MSERLLGSVFRGLRRSPFPPRGFNPLSELRPLSLRTDVWLCFHPWPPADDSQRTEFLSSFGEFFGGLLPRVRVELRRCSFHERLNFVASLLFGHFQANLKPAGKHDLFQPINEPGNGILVASHHKPHRDGKSRRPSDSPCQACDRFNQLRPVRHGLSIAALAAVRKASAHIVTNQLAPPRSGFRCRLDQRLTYCAVLTRPFWPVFR